MSNTDITRVGYDPFASSYDLHRADIVGGIFDDVVSYGKKAAKVAAAPVTIQVKAVTSAVKHKGSPAAVTKDLVAHARSSMSTASQILRSKGARIISSAALMFPPTAPAAAGVMAAGVVLNKLNKGSPSEKKQAATVLMATKEQSAKSLAAKASWAAVQTAQKMLKSGRKIPELDDSESREGMLFTADGQALQGRWVRV